MKRFSGLAARIYAIALNTFIEASRNRAFVGLGIAAVAMVVASRAISELAIRDQAQRVLIDFGLFAISLLAVIISVVMGVILIFKEIDRKTFYLVLPKPVRRSEVVIGKFAGLIGVIAIAVIVMGCAWFLSLWWREVPINGDMAKALLLIWLEAALITSVALFFSSFATPIMSGVFATGIFLIGRSVPLLEEMLQAKKGALVRNPFARALARFVVDTFPDLSVFHVGKEIILGVPVTWEYVAAVLLYCAGYCLFFLALGILIFGRRDFV